MLRSMRSSLRLGTMARNAYLQSVAARAAAVSTPTYFSRGNATAAAPAKTEAKKEAKQQYVTLQEIDRLLTHISREYRALSFRYLSIIVVIPEVQDRLLPSSDQRLSTPFHPTLISDCRQCGLQLTVNRVVEEGKR